VLGRRSFFRRSLATGLGLRSLIPASVSGKPSPAPPYSPNEFERVFANCDALDVLGRPRFWPQVREGYHPISPERVIVMTDKGGDGCSNRDHHQEDFLRASPSVPHEPPCLRGMATNEFYAPSGKLDLIFRLMRVMTDYYQVPQLFLNWMTGLAKRESLGSTGMGHGYGLLHQFQDDGMVQLTNAPVDWWLVVFPGGAGIPG